MARLDRGRFLIDREHLALFGNDGYLIAVWVLLNDWALIKPTEFKHGSKMTHLKRGELLTSISDISVHLSFTRTMVRKRLDFLKACGSIVCTQVHKGMKISIKNYEKNQTMRYSREPSETKDIANGGIDEIHREVQHEVQDEVQETDTYELINKETKKKRERDAHAREDPPSFLNSKLESGREEGTGKKEPLETNKKEPPDDLKLLAKDWFIRCQKVFREPDYDEIAVLDKILDIAKIYSSLELRQILDYLNSAPAKSVVAKELISPWHEDKPYFKTGMTLIQQAFIESTTSQEGKILLEKKKSPPKPSTQVENTVKKVMDCIPRELEPIMIGGKLYDFAKKLKT